jgi:hypothetical protein
VDQDERLAVAAGVGVSHGILLLGLWVGLWVGQSA